MQPLAPLASLAWSWPSSTRGRSMTRRCAGCSHGAPSLVQLPLTRALLTTPYRCVLSLPPCRAQQQGFVQVFLYDPGGALQRRERELKQALRWADPFQRIAVWAGWRAPPEWTATATDADKSADAAGRSMGVALLSAADAEWPLQAAGGAMEDPGGVDCNSASPQGTLEEAIAAPLELKRKLGRVAGPMAELEPDLVLVSGKCFCGMAVCFANFTGQFCCEYTHKAEVRCACACRCLARC